MLDLEIMDLFRAMPGSVAQGLIWGIMAIGVYITFRILDFADLTVDGSFALGGAVLARLATLGMNPFIATLFSYLSFHLYQGSWPVWSRACFILFWEFRISWRGF